MIFLVEDDASIRKLVVYALESQGYEAKGFDRPSAFWAAMEQQLPDLVLLDRMLPEEDGIQITALNTEFDRVEGLDAGADDYISKPFGMMELVARVRAVLRRGGIEALRTEDYRFGSLSVSPEKHEARVDGQPVALTFKEFLLLQLLIENRERVLTREVLLDRVWGLGTERENRTLDVHIRTLRAKLGSAAKHIQTVRGVGYRFVEEIA